MQHKFLNYNFENGYQTHNSILDTTPYKPEVIFIGTFNHGWDWNQSDFFYGRGMYMWPLLANLFIYNSNFLTKQRTINHNNPTFGELFEICSKGKIAFADIVKGINEDIPYILQNENKSVLVNNIYCWSTYKDGPLDYMGNQGWLDDNVTEIAKFINKNTTIKDVYFTFKSGDWIVEKMHEIKQLVTRDINFCSIFTPTANGFRQHLDIPYNERLWSLTHCWIWNGLEHLVPINKKDYCHLNHDWLISNGVNPNNF